MRYLSAPILLACLALAACSNSSSPVTPLTPQIAGAPVAAPSIHVMRPIRLGEPALTPAAANMTYHGGTVQLKPTVYLVLWGFTSKTRDPKGEARLLQKFLSGVGGSKWLGTLGQYYSNPGKQHITNPSHQLVKMWTDSATVPLHPSDDQIRAEAFRAQQHFSDFGQDVMYFIALPHGHDPTDFLKGNYCAYHSWGYSGANTVVYTNFPYNTDFNLQGYTCGENEAGGVLDGVSIAGGHELAEAQSDPRPSYGSSSAWYSGNLQGEVADLCARAGIKTIALSTGSFPMQPLWSNRLHGCTQG